MKEHLYNTAIASKKKLFQTIDEIVDNDKALSSTDIDDLNECWETINLICCSLRGVQELPDYYHKYTEGTLRGMGRSSSNSA